MIETDTCGECRHWDGNVHLMGGPCRRVGGLKYPGQSCDEFAERTSPAEAVILTFLGMLVTASIVGTLYFAWFLFWRAGYFG